MEVCQPDVEDSGAMNIAITGVGGGTGQAVIRALRRAALPCRFLGLDANPWSAGLYQCDARGLIPRVTDEERYLVALEGLIVQHKIDALFPCLDVELPAVSRAEDRFRALGCRPIVSSPDFIRIARDKLVTYRVLSSRNVPFARTMTLADFRRSCTPASFPVIVKPKSGAGSVGVTVLLECADLECYRPDSDDGDIVQEYLVPASWGVKTPSPHDLMKRGRLRQDEEFKLNGVIAPDGSIAGVFISVTGMNAGTTFRICPTKDPELLKFSHRVLSVLAEMGAAGPCQLQGRITKEGPVFYELNPRCTASTAARAGMGFNDCEAALRLFVLGEELTSVAPRLSYSTDTVCLRYVTEHLVPRADVERLL